MLFCFFTKQIMASSRSHLFWTLLLSVIVALECSNRYNYDVVRRDGSLYHLEPVSVVKRELPINNNIKTKPVDGNTAAQKLDKNSAASPSAEMAASSSVKKSLPSMDITKSPLDKEDDDDDIIKHFVNDTREETKPELYHDHHQYYNSTVVTEPGKIDEYWVDLSKMSQEKVITHEMLSKSYRRAATVSLTFDFPFYGHLLRNATIATGGFLYLGDYMHSWLASTQYIAPLMANFDTRLSDKSVIKYADNGTDFIVQWEWTYLQDHYVAGPFTFQARLRKSGDIVFAYKQIPITVASIPDGEHPVRVGVSDAYIIDRTLILHKRKIIYEYHRVEIDKDRIANLTAVYLTALPSCITLKDCESCLSTLITFKCNWCDKAERCSDGMDRHRHDWLMRGCDTLIQAPEDLECPAPATSASIDNSPNNTDDFSGVSTTTIPISLAPITDTSSSNNNDSHFPNSVFISGQESLPDNDSLTFNSQLQNTQSNNDNRPYILRGRSFGAAGIIGILFVVALVFGFVSWLIYAYKFPHSPSGQIIIKYRPSQWHWNRGEADYTPASVHI